MGKTHLSRVVSTAPSYFKRSSLTYCWVGVPEWLKRACLNPKNGLPMWAKTGGALGLSGTALRKFESCHPSNILSLAAKYRTNP